MSNSGSVFKKHEGNLGETGSVGWMFTRIGAVEATKTGTFDADEEAIEAGADDVHKNEDGSYEFSSSFENLDQLQKALTQRGWKVTSAGGSYKANNITDLSADQRKEVEEFLNAVDDLDDTHKVYATI